MTYLIKQAAWHPFNNDILILQEDGRLIYTLKATGFLIYRFLFPNFSILDQSSFELMQAARNKSLLHKSHALTHEKKSMGFVEQKSLRNYLISSNSTGDYHVHVAGVIKG